MKRGVFLIAAVFCMAFSSALYGQQEVRIAVGDSLTLNECSNKEAGFVHIDLVVKTRWVDRGLTYDRETGEGFYNYFFNEGDVDSRRLPCNYGGRKFRIACVHTYKNDDGSVRTVIMGQIDNEQTVLWIELEKAVQDKELILLL